MAMIARFINWPKLIGALAAAIGVALSLKGSEIVFNLTESLETVHGYVWLVVVVGAVSSLTIGFAAYRAREWARRALIGITIVAMALSMVHAYLWVTRSITVTGEFALPVNLWTRLLFFGNALRAVSPPAFFLLVLLHPDVVRSFRPAATRTI
jgi:hypothetical protein